MCYHAKLQNVKSNNFLFNFRLQLCLRKKNDSKEEVPKKSIFPRCSSRSLKIFNDRQWSKARVDVSDILILWTP